MPRKRRGGADSPPQSEQRGRGTSTTRTYGVSTHTGDTTRQRLNARSRANMRAGIGRSLPTRKNKTIARRSGRSGSR